MSLDKVHPPARYPLCLHGALKEVMAAGPTGTWVYIIDFGRLDEAQRFMRRARSWRKSFEVYRHYMPEVTELLKTQELRFRQREGRANAHKEWVVEMALVPRLAPVLLAAIERALAGGQNSPREF